jgi:alpha-amylase/alpha-mannosidase (GH57 family)
MRYLCIHGHFYQPPRENAWLESIEKQSSAHPFHNWNQRINHECYGPNRAARLLNHQGEITGILNNYEYISFNFGPTLLSWIEKNDPRTYFFIQKADQNSLERLGYGNAMAQVYNHIIMPLASRKDKITQVLWGKRDFEHRFGRSPEGMWLAETAVDLETLETMVDAGIQFVVLAPRQAEGEVDTTLSYTLRLPNNKSLRAFFYNGPLSQALAFEGLLNDGKKMADQILALAKAGADNTLLHFATDGESYGHHHRFGEMALAACIEKIMNTPGYQIVNYAWYTANFPAASEVTIKENSSWSCEHGVERWRANCGCKTGGEDSWHQHWRAPLRKALDNLRDRLDQETRPLMKKVFNDPLSARNEYIKVLLTKNPETQSAFFEKFKVADENQTTALRLMELQRNRMLMYTSCAWFFNEVSEIETTQVMQYALRAIQYGEKLLGLSLLKDFSVELSKAPSNKMQYKDASGVLAQEVLPKMLTLEKVAMHVATLCLFEPFPSEKILFNYRILTHTIEKYAQGNKILSMGKITIQSVIVNSRETFSFIAAYFGIQDLYGKISLETENPNFTIPTAITSLKWDTLPPSELKKILDLHLSGHSFSLDSLFKEEKEKIYRTIAEKNKKNILHQLQLIYDQNKELAAIALEKTHALFPPFQAAAQALFNERLESLLMRDEWPRKEKIDLLEEKKKWGLSLFDPEKYKLLLEDKILKDLDVYLQNPERQSLKTVLDELLEELEWAEKLHLDPERWALQNRVFRALTIEQKLDRQIKNSKLPSSATLQKLGFSPSLLQRAHS